MRRKFEESALLRWAVGLVLMPILTALIIYITFQTRAEAHMGDQKVHVTQEEKFDLHSIDEFRKQIKEHADKINHNASQISVLQSELRAITANQELMYDVIMKSSEKLDAINTYLLENK